MQDDRARLAAELDGATARLGDDGLIEYHGRFDGDDFEGAYRELDRRYYTGEGAAFACRRLRMAAQSHAGAIACRRCRARRLPHGWTFVPSSRRNPDMNSTNCRRFGDFVA